MAFEQTPLRNVTISSSFWSPILACARERIIPALINSQKALGHWYCLTWPPGHNVKPHPFWDSDIYKTIEAACY
ncbi:DUF1680 domain protein, partial [Rasamsonia emersonii CBS 393.64]